MTREKKTGRATVQLPKKALEKIDLGHSFAEYDRVLSHRDVYVSTPALRAAGNPEESRCFFVGRRGTGKTATTLFVAGGLPDKLRTIRPAVFSPATTHLQDEHFASFNQKPFKSLVASFRTALQSEFLSFLLGSQKQLQADLPPRLRTEVEAAEQYDFDERIIRNIRELVNTLASGTEEAWIRLIKKPRVMSEDLTALYTGKLGEYVVIIDSIDDYWDGSDRAVIYLDALMHATLEVNTHLPWSRTLIFLRENIFERVRAKDSEFARLETSVVGMEWTPEQLLEMIERRLNLPFSTRLAIGGPTWDYFFEQPQQARDIVFDHCQNRPRDVLTYCSLAVETAQSRKHTKVQLEDLLDARRRFSDSRLKDLADEYAENYPRLDLILMKFYGLGSRFTLRGMESFVQALLVQEDIKRFCATWLYDHTGPELFVRLLYNIGFVGLRTPRGLQFRSVGPRDTTPPPVTSTTDIVVHPSYHDALDLQDIVVGDLDTDVPFQTRGLVLELPESLDVNSYADRLAELREELATLPTGVEHAGEFENIVAEVIRLCFFRSLGNLEMRRRTLDGRAIRDIVVGNRAVSGFWELVRHRFGATQIVWECKNYAALDADDFRQVGDYLSNRFGRFGVLVFRGPIERRYFEHVRRATEDKDALILLLRDRDLQVFVRQAINGKVSEEHIRNAYDEMVRMVS